MPVQLDLPTLARALAAFGSALSDLLDQLAPHVVTVARALQEVEEGPEVVGLEAMLREKNMVPIMARLMSRGILRWGPQRLAEVAYERQLAIAARRLAKASTRKASGAVRQLVALLDTGGPSTLPRDVAAELRLDSAQLHSTAQAAIKGDKVACRTMRDYGHRLASCLPDPRGRQMGTKSGIAEMTYEVLFAFRHPCRPSWSDTVSDLNDPVTSAIRLVVNDPDYDPRPPWRRVEKRHPRIHHPRRRGHSIRTGSTASTTIISAMVTNYVLRDCSCAE